MAFLLVKGSIWICSALFAAWIWLLYFQVDTMRTYAMDWSFLALSVFAIVVAFLFALIFGYLSLKHVLFRIRHRRAPNEADFEALG